MAAEWSSKVRGAHRPRRGSESASGARLQRLLPRLARRIGAVVGVAVVMGSTMAVTEVAASTTLPHGPTAAPDVVNSSSGGAPVTISPLRNDTPGDAPLDPATFALFDSTGSQVTGPHVVRYEQPEGSFNLDPYGSATVTFAPAADYSGVATVAYRVSDQNGLTAQSTVTVYVVRGPTAEPDTATTTQGVAVTVNPLTNDVIGDLPLVPTTVELIDPTGLPVTTLRTPQGRYAVDPATGMITFTPMPTFVGINPGVIYRVTDENGETTRSTITITATAATGTPAPSKGPVARPDTATTPQATPVTLNPLANDLPGDTPLDPSAVKLLDPTGHQVTVLTTVQGVYVVKPGTGMISFLPASRFTGVTPAVFYVVADRSDLSARSTIIITVTPTRTRFSPVPPRPLGIG